MKNEIRDVTKKAIVEAYQKQVQEAIDHILGLEVKLSSLKKEYVKGLEENIKMAPYTLGYLKVLEPKKKK